TGATARPPGTRQFDGECIVCHTVGFAYTTGFADEKKTPLLKDVGCENCHGPGSAHIAAERGTDAEAQAAWRKLVNPWHPPENEDAKAKAKRLARVEQECPRGHDIDNDVNWVH